MPRKPTLREWAESATTEASVQSEIMQRAQFAGWHVWRTDVIHATVDHGEKGKRRVKQNTPGDPDLVMARCRLNQMMYTVQVNLGAIKPHAHLPADFVAIECKRPKGGKTSATQKARHAVLRKDGITVIVARSWAEVVREARKIGLEVER